MVGKLGHVKQVVGDAAHDGAHLGVVVVGVVQQQQVVKGVLAHIGFNMHAHDMADAGHKILRRSVNDTEHEVERCQLEHDLGGQRDAHTHGGVGNGAHDLGQDDIAHGGQGCTEQVDEQHLFVLGQIGQKAPDESPAAGMVCTGVMDGCFRHNSSSLQVSLRTTSQSGLRPMRSIDGEVYFFE